MLNKSKNMKTFVILGLAAGVLLIILSVISSGAGEQNARLMREQNLSRIDSSDYVRIQEEKITEIIERIEGVRNPFVMLTLETSSEHQYAVKQNIRESTRNGEITQRDVSKEIMFYGDDKQPILIREIKPVIRGVAVVAEGISNAETQLQILNLVSTVLNVPTNRVYVISAD